MMKADSHIDLYDLGIAAYGDVLDLQHTYHDKAVEQRANSIFFLQHKPVITIGHFAEESDFVVPKEILQKQGVDCFKIERGGKLTAHMPGQLVVYPILHLSHFDLSTRKYVSVLEETVIATLQRFGITASTDSSNPGVWVGEQKVAAVGIRIKNRATMHGFALNVNNEMELFRAIVPCGLQNRGVTSMQQLLQRPVNIEEIKSVVATELLKRLGVSADDLSLRSLDSAHKMQGNCSN